MHVAEMPAAELFYYASSFKKKTLLLVLVVPIHYMHKKILALHIKETTILPWNFTN